MRYFGTPEAPEARLPFNFAPYCYFGMHKLSHRRLHCTKRCFVRNYLELHADEGVVLVRAESHSLPIFSR